MSELGEYRYLPARLAERLRGVEIGVRRPMDGTKQGLHRSPAFGSSVEFAEYREYRPGDPIARIDWPVYARSDRYVIRRFHEDVSIRCYVLLDISGSMLAEDFTPNRLVAAKKVADEFENESAAGAARLGLVAPYRRSQ